MTIIALGINHTTAPVHIREKTSFSNDTISQALSELTYQKGVSEAAILSTCNRTEIYCNLEQDQSRVPVDWLSEYHGLTPEYLEPFLYTYPDTHAVKHILRVASGLDSMVIGESQVLGQLKSAYQAGLKAGSIGKLLDRLFQYSFRVAKQIRTTTTIGNHPISVAFTAVKLAKQIFGDLSRQTALLIGAGSTIDLVAKHLHENRLSQLIIANRELEKAQHLAAQYSAYAMTLKDIPQHLAEADIIISSTASQVPVLGKSIFENAIKVRKHRPMFVIDIAVPRDIEPETGQLDDIYLYTIDDLQNVIQDNLRSRQDAAQHAEKIIDDHAMHFMDWLNSLDAVSTICALRDQAKSIQQEIITLAEKDLDKGINPKQVIQNATRTLTNKLIHSPSNRLHTASKEGRKDLISAAHELFALNPNTSSSNKEK